MLNMSIPRLRPEETALLVIDLQEKLMPTIHEGDRISANTAVILQAAGVLDLPFLLTEHYPRGLGRTIDEVAAAMPDPSRRIEKTKFSAAVDLVMEHLRAFERPSILICGVEAHVCVLQTVLDLQASGFQCFMMLDAISAGQPEQIAPAIRRMERAGGISTGVLSVLYELMGDARHPAFKELLPLAKLVR